MTTREKEIREEAGTQSIAMQNKRILHNSYFGGFVDGALWADEHPNWISIKDEKPKEDWQKELKRLKNMKELEVKSILEDSNVPYYYKLGGRVHPYFLAGIEYAIRVIENKRMEEYGK